MLWIPVVISILIVVYWNLRRRRQYWTKKGVQQKTNGFILGDTWGPFVRKQSMAEMVQMVYEMCPKTRYSGFNQMLTPILVLKDPDLIKQITVKDFDHFVNHFTFIPEECDSLINSALFALKNQKWRDMRMAMTPAFTSSKMKYMFTLISQCGEQFVKHFIQKKDDLITVEMKDFATKYTNDVIASIAFGVEIDSVQNPENEFYLMGKNLIDFKGIMLAINVVVAMLSPKLYKMLKLSPFSKIPANFFTNLVQNNIDSRRKYKIVRPDMINILLEAQNVRTKNEVEDPETSKFLQTKMTITDEEIISQAFSFFIGGFESVSTTICFTSHELGVNPEIQEKLIQEIDEGFEVCNGKITYDVLLGMKYLDMVVSEGLRKWPTNLFTERVCTKSYTIEPKYPDEKPVDLEIGSYVWIPIFGIQRDPKNYPDPERFDPERFSDENKGNVNPYTYLTFGVGPRNCLGSRLALLEIKIFFFYLLSNYEIVPVEKTQIPLKTSRSQLTMTAEGGFWLGLKRRSKSM